MRIGAARVIRGGAWDSAPGSVRCSAETPGGGCRGGRLEQPHPALPQRHVRRLDIRGGLGLLILACGRRRRRNREAGTKGNRGAQADARGGNVRGRPEQLHPGLPCVL